MEVGGQRRRSWTRLRGGRIAGVWSDPLALTSAPWNPRTGPDTAPCVGGHGPLTKQRGHGPFAGGLGIRQVDPRLRTSRSWGEGGMGIVYRARHPAPDRGPQDGAGRAPARFIGSSEAEAVRHQASPRHAGLRYGDAEGQPFQALEYPGGTLTDRLRPLGDSPHESRTPEGCRRGHRHARWGSTAISSRTASCSTGTASEGHRLQGWPSRPRSR